MKNSLLALRTPFVDQKQASKSFDFVPCFLIENPGEGWVLYHERLYLPSYVGFPFLIWSRVEVNRRQSPVAISEVAVLRYGDYPDIVRAFLGVDRLIRNKVFFYQALSCHLKANLFVPLEDFVAEILNRGIEKTDDQKAVITFFEEYFA